MSLSSNALDSYRAGSGPEQLDVLSRREFLEEFGQKYGSGQHVTLLGPTQRGKTRLCHEMLSVVISPTHQAVLLAGKPAHRDPVMSAAAENLNLVLIEQWPPTATEKYKARKRNGYVLRPRQTLTNVTQDETSLRNNFGRSMVHNYSQANDKRQYITVADEAHLIQNEYKLRKQLEAPLMRGAPHNAMWCLIQRGAYMTYHCYDAPEWFLIAYDPDVANQKRYSEIGGVDPKYLMRVLKGLRTQRGDNGRSTVSEFLCIQRSGPELFIVSVT